jgi:hypothetical protein
MKHSQAEPSRRTVRPGALADWALGGLALAASLLAGCQSQTKAPPVERVFKGECAPVKRSAAVAGPSRVVRVYVDASASMRGFAVPPAARFLHFLKRLENSLLTGWADTAIQLFRFGEAIQPIPDTPGLQLALQPNFYGDKVTKIDEPLGTVQAGDLTVVVTDLLQTNGSMTFLVRTMLKNLLGSRLSLGIWGLRSEFNGTVYGAEWQGPTFSYRTTNEPRTLRPFYMLVIGRREDVLRYVRVINTAYPAASTDTFLLLAPEVVEKPLEWKVVGAGKLTGVAASTGVVQPGPPGAAFGSYKFVGGAQAAAIAVELEYLKLPHAPGIRFQGLGRQARCVKLCRRSNLFLFKKLREPVDATPEVSAAVRFELNESKSGPGRLAATVRIEPKRRLPEGVLALEYRPSLKADAFELPSWCEEWNMEPEQLAAFSQNPATFDGSRTPGLSEFVRTVWAAMVREHSPELGSLYLYLEN